MKWPAAARRRVQQHPSLANRFPQGRREWLSPAHDKSGLGSARLSGKSGPFRRGWMRRTGALQGLRMAVFLNILNRWESAELNQERQRSSWGERADVPALDSIGFVSPKCPTRHLRKSPHEKPLDRLQWAARAKIAQRCSRALSPEGTAAARRSIK